jgi:transcriptional antiterminator NusG
MSTATKGMQFFVLRVASNKEDRVREALVRKVKIEGLENVVGRILVPTERVRSIKDGKRRDTDRKLYPGYVFIELELDQNGTIPEKVWFMIKETEGVGDFIGSNGKPTPMSPLDQDKMLTLIQEVLDEGPRRGFPLTRLVAHMEWALEDRPGVNDLVEYETRLNYILPRYKDPVI